MANSIRIAVGVDDTASAALGQIKTTGTEAATKIQGAFGGLGAAISSAGGQFKESVKSFATDAFAEVGDVMRDQVKFGLDNALQGLGVDPETSASIARNAAQLAGVFGGGLSDTIGAALSKNVGPKLVAALSQSAIGPAITPIFSALGIGAGEAMDTGVVAAPALLPALLIAAIGAAILLIVSDPSIPGKALDIGVGIVRGIVGGLASLAQLVGDAIAGVFANLWTTAQNIVTGVASFAANIPGAIVEGLATLARAVGTFIAGVISGLWSGASGIQTSIASFAANIPGAIVNGAATLATALATFVSGVFNALWNAAKDVSQSVLNFAANIPGAIIDGAAALADDLVKFVSGVFNGLWQAGAGIAKTVLDFAANIPGAIVDGAASLADDLIKFISGVFNGLWEVGKGVAKTVTDFAANIPGAIVSGAKDLATSLVTFVSGVINGLWKDGVGIAKAVAEFAANIPGAIVNGLASLAGDIQGVFSRAFNSLSIDVGPFHLHGGSFTIDQIKLPWDTNTNNAGPGSGSRVPYVPPRALGGDVRAGLQYLVGERGPELFRPDTDGSIVPNNQLGAASSRGGVVIQQQTVIVNNPEREPASTSVQKNLTALAAFGVLGGCSPDRGTLGRGAREECVGRDGARASTRCPGRYSRRRVAATAAAPFPRALRISQRPSAHGPSSTRSFGGRIVPRSRPTARTSTSSSAIASSSCGRRCSLNATWLASRRRTSQTARPSAPRSGRS